MEMILRALLLIFSGLVLLRISGRKSISQMTIAHTIIMISIGSLIVQPIADKSIGKTIITASTFIVFIIAMDFLQLKFNFIEQLITGKSITIIEDGEIVSKNLQKIKLTVDQFEMRLRQQGISSISDVKTATLEPNGQLGYELKDYAKPLTVGQMEKMLKGILGDSNKSSNNNSNIFDEVRKNQHSKYIDDKLK